VALCRWSQVGDPRESRCARRHYGCCMEMGLLWGSGGGVLRVRMNSLSPSVGPCALCLQETYPYLLTIFLSTKFHTHTNVPNTTKCCGKTKGTSSQNSVYESKCFPKESHKQWGAEQLGASEIKRRPSDVCGYRWKRSQH